MDKKNYFNRSYNNFFRRNNDNTNIDFNKTNMEKINSNIYNISNDIKPFNGQKEVNEKNDFDIVFDNQERLSSNFYYFNYE